ncbi:MFS transporter [Pandoraea sputorum]|uniref:Enterobactin exporter EntS n=2 Tax=Pandoraea sputorum TaxID=93222 RepID=A0A239SJU8_9BURK|nr:enterobactin exporter EntS [Pandoraea sputorum]VVD83185.1 MFS transporter [Pandoraea sputorum]
MSRNLPMWSMITLNFLGEGIFRSSIPVLAISLNSDPSAIGMSIAASKLPWLFSPVLVGFAIDHLSFKKIILSGSLIRLTSLSIIIVLILLESLNFSEFIVLSTIITIGDISAELAIQTSIPKISQKQNLKKINSLFLGLQAAFSQLIAPILAGAALIGGPKTLIESLIVIQIGIILIHGHPKNPQSIHKNPIRTKPQQILTPLKDRTLFGTLLVASIMMTSYGVWSSAFALYVFDSASGLGLTTFGYGLMMSSIAFGSLTGTILSTKLISNLPHFPLICASILAMTVLPLVGLTGGPPMFVSLALFIYGFFLAIWNVVSITYRQRFVPERVLGRITGIYRSITWGFMPLGAVLGSFICTWESYRVALALAAALSILQLISLPLLRDIGRRHAQRLSP